MTELERAAAWQSMTKAQRIKWLRQGNVLSSTSAQRSTAVAALKKNAALT